MSARRGVLRERSVALATGVRLAYVEQGDPAGAPVVMLHGVTDSWRSFEPVLAHVPSELRTFALSQRGHGGSSCPDEGYSYSALAADLDAFMDALELPRAIVVGHSMGSMVAQRFAVDRPERVAGLVLVGAFRTLFRHPELSTFVAEAIATLRDPIDAEFARTFQLSTLAQNIDVTWLDTFVAESCRVPSRVWRALFEGFLATPDFSGELHRVPGPVLVAWGDCDLYARRADQDALVRAFPRARLQVYEGAGHALHWEEPRRFARDLSAFAQQAVLSRLEEVHTAPA